MPPKTKRQPAKKSTKISPLAVIAGRLKTIRPAQYYVLVSLIILVLSVIFWSILGADIQKSNADQLVNSYLFENSTTAQGASLPGTHSFLLKWPLFYAIKLLGYSTGPFITLTVLCALATVAVLAYILYRIERRPIIFGTICLALASVLLLVPAQPYPGALLPINMAMIATRNLEYALYLLAIILLIKSAGKINRWSCLAVGSLGLLIASDKLFLGISIIGALLALTTYSLRKKWETVTLSSNWLVLSLAGAILGIFILAIINASNVVNVVSGSAGSPYSIVGSGKDLALGVIYSGFGLLTNFGANPAYQATILKNIPHSFGAELLSPSGPGYLINLAILGFCLYTAYYLMKNSLVNKKSVVSVLDQYSSLALMLLFSTVAAFGLFIFSNHYYAVDARYLTIALFSLFICAALFTRSHKWPEKYVIIAGGIIAFGVIFGIAAGIKTHDDEADALADVNSRNLSVAQALKAHPVDVLVGDYWRVVPTRQASGNKLKVLPLVTCTEPRQILSSTNWQPDLKKHSFSYLLSLDKSLSDYPRCSLDQILAAYGRPNASTVIAGSLTKPKELLLFYDRGAHPPAPNQATPPKTTTILPVSLDELPMPNCPGLTVMNVVAHEDDDLLFLNPDLLHDIKEGHCVRTVYVTAGDSGSNEFYWLHREQGSEAAYSKMLDKDDIWIQRSVQLGDHQFITVVNPRGNSKVSLIFMHLPDGNIHGEGFSGTGYQNLAKLQSNQIPVIHSVDKQSSYTLDQINSALESLMRYYQPAEIRTQANFSNNVKDHSDHAAVGRLTKTAHAKYEQVNFENLVNIPLRFYIGYPIGHMPENVFGEDRAAKEAAFFRYSNFDGATCDNIEKCNKGPYGLYLTREYQNSY